MEWYLFSTSKPAMLFVVMRSQTPSRSLPTGPAPKRCSTTFRKISHRIVPQSHPPTHLFSKNLLTFSKNLPHPHTLIIPLDPHPLPQPIKSMKEETWWNVLLSGDFAAFQQMYREDPAVLWARDPKGACALHLLVLYNTPAHVELARHIIDALPMLCDLQYAGTDYKVS